MKKQSNFLALMALAAMGVMFVSCTNVDNPYNVTTPDGKYVLVKDSIVSTDGGSKVAVWEYDAQGRVTKETFVNNNPDGTSLQEVSTYTYSQNLITRETLRNGVDPSFAYFYLNSKGLIERFKYEASGYDCIFKYDDDDRVMTCTEAGHSDTVVWKNGDVEKYVAVVNTTSHAMIYTSSHYEVNFPYLMPYLLHMDNALSPMGLFGKATRHLISNIHFEAASDGKSATHNESYSYVVRSGLVMEFIVDIDDLYTENGETEEEKMTHHHYFTWKKL